MEQFRRFIVRATRTKAFVHSFALQVSPQDTLINDNYHEKKSIFILVF